MSDIFSRLAAGDWVVRRDAVRELGRHLQAGIPDEDLCVVIEALPVLAGDDKWEVRHAAALALQYLQHESFDRILSRLLEDAHFDVRRAAERALRKRKSTARLGEWDDLDALSTDNYEDILGKHLPPKLASRVHKLSQRWLRLVVGASVHELRSILTPLKSRVSKAARNLTPKGLKKAREHLKRARERSDYLVQVLDSMDDWAGEGQRPPEFQKTSVDEMVREAVSLVRDDFEARFPKKKKVRVTIDCPGAMWIDAPRPRLIQAFRNIIQNSFEAIDKHGTIRISGSLSSGRARIEFHDDGCGMSDETRQFALRPFTSTKGSSGLGLAIAYRTIHGQCGGEIDFPAAKKGTIVVVTLPTDQAPDVSE